MFHYAMWKLLDKVCKKKSALYDEVSKGKKMCNGVVRVICQNPEDHSAHKLALDFWCGFP